MTEHKASPLRVGTLLLGRYEVRACLGRGGHAHVYEAYDAFVDRAVAIKVIGPSESGSQELLRRAQSEARVLARLQHPNIVRMYEAGMTDEGFVYLVMEKLEGRTLLDVSRDPGRLRPREALEIAVQIADALLVAHVQGVLHRDLKPANVFVTADNRIKVLDFGVAKIKDYGAHSTRRDVIQGTMIYMAPEQLQGLTLTPRSDIFALGTMLYELLYRHPVLLGECVPSFAEVGWLQIATLPPMLDTLDPSIPRYVARFVQRCLLKRPEDRFESMLQVAEAARTALERMQHEGKPELLSLRELSLPTGLAIEQQATLHASQKLTLRPYLPTAEPELEKASNARLRPGLEIHGEHEPRAGARNGPGRTLRILNGPLAPPQASFVHPVATQSTRTASPRWQAPRAVEAAPVDPNALGSVTETGLVTKARRALGPQKGVRKSVYLFVLVGVAFFSYWQAAGRDQGTRPPLDEVLEKSVVTKRVLAQNLEGQPSSRPASAVTVSAAMAAESAPPAEPSAEQEAQPSASPRAKPSQVSERAEALPDPAAAAKVPRVVTKSARSTRDRAATLFDLPFALPDDEPASSLEAWANSSPPKPASANKPSRAAARSAGLIADPVDEVYGPSTVSPAQPSRGAVQRGAP
ncbi:MAG TPA: protein kinase [Polyangiaceae bacterium]|nr:protein kinase [Polyangiaceae bacterium]